MSTFGKELLASLGESSAHAGGDGSASTETPISPRQVREEAGLTQVDMARLMGMSLSGYRKWEQGTRSVSGPAEALLRVIQEEPEAVQRAVWGGLEERAGVAHAGMDGCAICRRRDVEYSVEHVIPEALGGHYVCKTLVCVDCNHRMGQRVDKALVTHWLSELWRFTHGVRGKAKRAPNPFRGDCVMRGDGGRKAQVRVGADGRLVPYVLPEVECRELDAKHLEVAISVDRKDEGKIEGMVRKIAARAGVSADEALAQAERTVVTSNSGLFTRRSVDTRDFKIGLLKIAYEFAADRVPGYLQSKQARELAEVIREARFEDVERYVNIGDGFDKRILAPFSRILGFDGLKHYLILWSSEERLACFVHLHELFSVGVTLANEGFGEFMEFGVNDVERRSFKVWRLEDMVPPTIAYRPLLHFDREQDAVRFREAEGADDFGYESRDGAWTLYGANGRELGVNVRDLVAQLDPIWSGVRDGHTVDEYRLGGELFLRTQKSEAVRVVGFAVECAWTKL